MNRSVGALWRSVIELIVLGLIMLGGALWWFGVIAIGLGARVEPSSTKPMISEIRESPDERPGEAKNFTVYDYRLFQYTRSPIDVWVEREHNGKWEEVLHIFGSELGLDEPGWHPTNSSESPQAERPEDRARVKTTTPAPPLLGHVVLVTHLDTRRGNLRIYLQLTAGGQTGQSHGRARRSLLINPKPVLPDDQTAPIGTITSREGGVLSQPTVLNDELTLYDATVGLKAADCDVTHHIRLKVRPSRSARSED